MKGIISANEVQTRGYLEGDRNKRTESKRERLDSERCSRPGQCIRSE